MALISFISIWSILSTVKLETLANRDLRNFGEINVGKMLTLKSVSNYNYVENWNICVVMCVKPYFVSNNLF